MALTFWAELYFRSLKASKVLSILTQYLIQYKKVCIPHVGTFQLVQESPELDVAEQLCRPPLFTTHFISTESIADHQIHYVAGVAHLDNAAFELSTFGQQLNRNIRQQPFRWNGFGTLRYASNQIVFEPSAQQPEGWQAIPAHKVLRENVNHQMLVGDRQMNAHDEPARSTILPRRATISFTVAVVLLLVALVAIAVVLYIGGFRPSSAGLRLPL
jgi:hypothetical protein